MLAYFMKVYWYSLMHKYNIYYAVVFILRSYNVTLERSSFRGIFKDISVITLIVHLIEEKVDTGLQLNVKQY